MACDPSSPGLVITPEALLQHWQGHRGLTRGVIEAFPEDEFFRFSIGGMRPFSALAMEFIRMAAPTLRGVVTGVWNSGGQVAEPRTKADVLQLWDEATEEINKLWPIIPRAGSRRPVYGLLFYVIDNEIHHRGQGYVYLRALGIAPPLFYDRS